MELWGSTFELQNVEVQTFFTSAVRHSLFDILNLLCSDKASLRGSLCLGMAANQQIDLVSACRNGGGLVPEQRAQYLPEQRGTLNQEIE